mgnify:CR=1 FL=1
MGHLSYEDAKKRVVFGLVLLAIVTLVEVFVSLLGKGHIFPGVEDMTWLVYVAGLIIIALSLYKAYFIVYEFMHMKYEMRGLAMSVLLPTLLLIWAIIAFFQEGDSWKDRREQIKEKNEEPLEEDSQGMIMEDTYILEQIS